MGNKWTNLSRDLTDKIYSILERIAKKPLPVFLMDADETQGSRHFVWNITLLKNCKPTLSSFGQNACWVEGKTYNSDVFMTRSQCVPNVYSPRETERRKVNARTAAKQPAILVVISVWVSVVTPIERLLSVRLLEGTRRDTQLVCICFIMTRLYSGVGLWDSSYWLILRSSLWCHNLHSNTLYNKQVTRYSWYSAHAKLTGKTMKLRA